MTYQRELHLEEVRRLQAEEDKRQWKLERDRKAAERLAADLAAQREKEQAAGDAAARKTPAPDEKREIPSKDVSGEKRMAGKETVATDGSGLSTSLLREGAIRSDSLLGTYRRD